MLFPIYEDVFDEMSNNQILYLDNICQHPDYSKTVLEIRIAEDGSEIQIPIELLALTIYSQEMYSVVMALLKDYPDGNLLVYEDESE